LRHALEEYCLRFGEGVSFHWVGAHERMPFAVESAAYFCVVLVVDDCVAAGHVSVRVEQSSQRLEVRMATVQLPGAVPLQLLEDRVSATDGNLSRPATAAEGRLTMTWIVTASAGDAPPRGPAAGDILNAPSRGRP
jgi:hypothetical protein